MYSEEDIDNAVNNGVLTKSSANAFRNYIEKTRNTVTVDEEHFRFIQGFNDIFVSISSILLLSCIPFVFNSISPLISCFVIMLISWCAAEYFTRKRRMALTSIILVTAYLISCFALPFIILVDDVSRESYAGLYIGVFVAISAYFHWRRFEVPITLAYLVSSIAYGVSVSVASHWSDNHYFIGTVALVSGLLVLAIAIFWDASDRERSTKKSDIAFWLHLSASPLIVHGVFSYLNVFDMEANFSNAFLVLVFYIFLALISISLDRRALMVSSIVYVLVIFSKLFDEYGDIDNGFAYTGIVVGFGLLILSAFWHRLRAFLIMKYPKFILNLIPA